MAITVVGNQTVAGSSYIKIRAGVVVVDPAASVTYTAPVAGVSYVSMRAGVTTDDPVANITYVAPVAGISYIELAAIVQIDTSGRYQFVPDRAVMSDGVSLSLARPVADLIYTADATRYEFEKVVTDDGVALTDEFTKLLVYVRSFADTLGLPDAQALDITKLLQDSFVASDAAAKHVTKTSADTFALSDANVKQFTKRLTDAYGLTDVARRSFIKAASDTATAPDAMARAFFKALTDTFSLQDTELFSLAKLISDGVAMNDGFDAGDGAVYTFSKGVSNVTMVSDATSRHPRKVTSDTVTTADAGSLISQSYCDITYFAEDYVGESRVF